MANHTLGVDVGGTKIEAGIVTPRYRIIRRRQTPLDRASKKGALTSITAAIDDLINVSVRRIGIGITGFVSPDGIVHSSPNLPPDWKRVPVRRLLERRYRLPVTVENDADAIGMAEARVGAGKRYRSILTLTIGTGIGSALVIDGALFRGGHRAVEFGHTVVTELPFRCSCGHLGHLEAVVSGPALRTLYYRHARRMLTSEEIYRRRLDDRHARLAINEMTHFLATGLANAAHAYSPEIIVLNGGLARLPWLVRPAIVEARSRLMLPPAQRPRFAVSRLGYAAGVLGAAILAAKPVPRN